MKHRTRQTDQSLDPTLNEDKRTSTSAKSISSDERLQWIAEAAYYRSQSKPLESQDPLKDWLQAERDIDTLIQDEPSQNSVKIDNDHTGQGARHTITADPDAADPLPFC